MSMYQCTHPVTCYQSVAGGRLYFNYRDIPLAVAGKGVNQLVCPCGKCIGCRLRSKRDWTVRAACEMRMHDESSFVTLTYDDEHLPRDGSVQKRDLQLFFKSFRKNVDPIKIRYMACGEYGDATQRPHYHALVFGFGFPDRAPWSKSDAGILQYRSPFLESLWPRGNCLVADASDEYAAYVAGYVCKKLDGVKLLESGRASPFVLTSRRPGLGAPWFEKYQSECMALNADGSTAADEIVIGGKRYGVPLFFQQKFRLQFQNEFNILKANRLEVSHGGVDITSIVRHQEWQEYVHQRKKVGKL